MPTQKQAEYLASAIEKGLVVSQEELRQRVRGERERARELENGINRRAACIGAMYTSTWPAGGEPLRIGGSEDVASEDRAVPTLKEHSSFAGRLKSRKLFSADFCGPVPLFVRKLARRDSDDKPVSHGHASVSASENALHGATSRHAVEAIDQEPWKRAGKQRALTDAERSLIGVYFSQKMLSGLVLQSASFSIRPLDPAVDLCQVMDTIRADYTERENGVPEGDEWLAGLVDRPQRGAGKWTAAVALRRRLEQDDAALYSIVDDVTTRSVGVISLRDNAPEALRVEIASILLPRSLLCTSVMVEILQLLLEYIFENLRYIRVKVGCCASVQCLGPLLLQLGFKYEGTQRQAFHSCTGRHDLLIYRMLDSDWVNEGRSNCNNLLNDHRQDRSASQELEGFRQRTSSTRDENMEGDNCFAYIAANAALELVVNNVMSFAYTTVLRYQEAGLADPFCAGYAAKTAPQMIATEKVVCEKGRTVHVGASRHSILGTGELIGKNVVLQPLQPHGGVYEGQISPIFSKLTAEEVLLRFAPPELRPDEIRLQQYLWKLRMRNASAFALRVGVKGDGKPRDLISRADLATAGFIFARVSGFPCPCLQVGPIFVDHADVFVHTETWLLLLEHAFTCGVERVEILIESTASGLCLQLLRLGFSFECNLRQWFVSEDLFKDVVCYAVTAGEEEHVAAMLSRRLQALSKDEQDRCIFPPLSEALELKVAFQRPAIGVEFTETPPIFAKRIHPVKGLGLPASLTEIVNEGTGPFLAAVNDAAADGLTRKELLALLRALPRPVVITFRVRAARPKDLLVHGEAGYKAVLGARASLLSEVFKRDHPSWYQKTPAGFSERSILDTD